MAIIIDGMALVKEMVKTCEELLDCCIRSVDGKPLGYVDTYLVFDNYSINNLLRTESTGEVDNTTCVKDFKSFLSTIERPLCPSNIKSSSSTGTCEVFVPVLLVCAEWTVLL